MKRLIGAAALVAGLVVASPSAGNAREATAAAGSETIVFAGGCFWGIESVFDHTKGVVSAVSGYAGGWTASPTYEQVSTGRTGYAESVQVTFDPSQVSLDQLLRIFFTVAHDPTELNRQGPDVGTQYRSMVLYSNDAQGRAVKAFVDQLAKSHVYAQPIVTELKPLKEFHPAEAYHQRYAEKHPNEPYIMYNDAPKVAALKQRFPALYRAGV